MQRQSLWGYMMSAEGVYILSAKTCFGGITMEKETLIVVGLGNPGTQYAHTRHNAGFDTLEMLCRKWGVTLNKSKCKGLLTETNVDGKRVVLCAPQTFMNLSGECVSELLNWYKVPLENLLIIMMILICPPAACASANPAVPGRITECAPSSPIRRGRISRACGSAWAQSPMAGTWRTGY